MGIYEIDSNLLVWIYPSTPEKFDSRGYVISDADSSDLIPHDFEFKIEDIIHIEELDRQHNIISSKGKITKCIVTANTGCAGCYYYSANEGASCRGTFLCNGQVRTDKTDIIFEPVG